MPTYVYKFTDTGETVEVQQAFSDATLTEYAHPVDGTVRAVKKVFTPVGVTFKGSGFYKTDSRGSSSKSTTSTTSSTDTSTTNGTSTSSDTSSSSSSSSSSTPASTPSAPASTPSSTSAAAS
jgi:predicted nucleic acid-binding Zn ribbon protein